MLLSPPLINVQPLNRRDCDSEGVISKMPHHDFFEKDKEMKKVYASFPESSTSILF